jgi:TonB-dependent starch-binding outer membrane protein SusC
MNLANFEHSEPNRIDGLSRSNNYSLQWNWANTINYQATYRR